tara:strand:+ start:1048 stop:4101 length:3054 start_codon:yes stop_codon:yes gene_type:complete
MKIYNKVVYDKDDNVLLEDSYQYNGPIAKASGDDVKGAVTIGAIAVGVGFFAGTLGTGPLAGALSKHMSSGLATFIASAGTSLVLSSVSRKFAPDAPELPSLGTNIQQGTMVSVKEAIKPYRVIYGKTRVGGNIVFAETTDNNQYIHMIFVVAGHEVNNITKVFFDDAEVPLTQSGADSNGVARLFPSSGNTFEGKVRIKKHLGTSSQAADADLVSDVTNWTTDHRIRGKAYVYARLEFDSDIFPSGIPNITFEVEGKKVFDPRDSSTAFSSNPALCIRDYLTDTTYGLSCATSEIDDTNFTSAANTCDESVSITNPSGTEKRFTCNGTFEISQSPKNILENFLSTVGGNLIYSNGTFKLKPAVFSTPTVTLDESNLRSPLNINTRVSKKELFNAVKGIYSEPDNLYQPQDYPFLTSSTFESEDNSERIFADFNFPFTQSSHTCQRLAKIQLQKARQQISVEATFDLNAFQLEVGDTVRITNSRMGFSAKEFEVTGWNFNNVTDSDGNPGLVVNCSLRETASAVYDFSTSDYSSITSGATTNLPTARQVSAPSAVTLTDELVQYNDGTVIVKLVIELTAPSDNFTEQFEVEVKQDTDADGTALSPADSFKLIGRGTRTKYEFLNVIDKATYSVRARGVNVFGAKSSTITASRTIIGQIAPPSDVENFACNIIGKEAHLSFDPVTDLDLSHYRINFAPVTTGAEWQNSIVLVKKLSRPGTSIVVPARTGTYLIKAVDKLGNVSINASEVVTQVTTLGANFTSLITQNENPDFSGTKTDVVKTTTGDDNTPCLVLKGNQLFDDVTGNFDSITQTLFDGGENATVKSSGTYEFASVIDAGAVLTTQITATLTQQVTDRARIFDFVSGDFDDQPSNFDGDANTQCSSELQISVSDDNVTYSTFQDFSIGDYTGRFFKFRVLMQSDNNTATPIVTAVGVELQLEEFQTSENDVVSGTGTKSITYPRAFNILNSIAITLSIQDMASGDKYAISSKSKTGFNIAFQNSSGSGVSRTFDYVAKGV